MATVLRPPSGIFRKAFRLSGNGLMGTSLDELALIGGGASGVEIASIARVEIGRLKELENWSLELSIDSMNQRLVLWRLELAGNSQSKRFAKLQRICNFNHLDIRWVAFAAAAVGANPAASK